MHASRRSSRRRSWRSGLASGAAERRQAWALPEDALRLRGDRTSLVILAVVGGILLLMAVVPLVAVSSFTSADNRLVGDMDALLRTAEQINGLMVDQETGQRGYIITADPSFLEPYDRGRATLAQLWPQAQQQAALVGGRAPALVAATQQAANVWQQTAETEIALVQSGRQGAAVQSVAGRAGKGQFDTFRRQATALTDYAETLRANELRHRAALEQRVYLALAALGGLGLVALGLLAYLTTTARRYRLRAAYSEATNRAKDEFLSLAAHELKTPLTAIRLGAQVLVRQAGAAAVAEAPERPGVARHASVIARQTDRLGHLVDQLLDVSRVATDRLELQRAPHDLVALARGAIDLIQPTAPRHPIRLVASSPELVIPLDAGRIEQVLLNLLTNAVKYSPHPAAIDVALTANADGVVCSVTDHGIGLPREALAHVFEQFYRARNARQTTISGLGLGLYLSDQIVRRHGGRLWVESAEGEGSTFAMFLPAASLVRT